MRQISNAQTMDTITTPRSAAMDRSTNRYEKKFKINNKTNFLTTVLLIFNLVNSIQCTEDFSVSNATEDETKGRSILSAIYNNGTFNSGNMLWDNILNQCTAKPTISCLQKNIYNYLDDSLGFNGDVNVTSAVCLKKNNVDVSKFTEEANIIYLKGSRRKDREEFAGRDIDDNEIDDDLQEDPESPLEEVTDALYNKGVKFLVTHDMRWRLPEIFFHGATLRISPRALTKTGALVHVDLEPKESVGEGRIFFKKIKKYIKKKLVMAALAIILVVKLLALKLLFVLPVVLGVTTAKKIFLKVLLFLFPALSHIFKLCSWYHQNYHTTKYHHHHHLITHHHHKPPHGHGHGHGPGPGHGPYGPPPGHHTTVHQPAHDAGGLEHYPQDWELSGPGLGSEYLAADIHRNAIANFKPNVNDMNDINAWGLGLPPGQSMNLGEVSASQISPVAAPPPGTRPGYPTGRPTGPPVNPYNRNKQATPQDPEKEALIRAAALAARAPPSPVRDELLRVSSAKLHETNRIRSEAELVRQQQEILAAEDPDTQAADKFYGPLLDKVDSILQQLGAGDAPCRERAICALYRDPFKHAPYSNLVSNQLSKDSSELVPPADSKLALRYYRYVQAAREGQEHSDCGAAYPECNLNFS